MFLHFDRCDEKKEINVRALKIKVRNQIASRKQNKQKNPLRVRERHIS